MKIVDLQKLWNYVVDNFLIWNYLIMQNYVWISQIWNSNFSNDFGWKNFLNENCRSRRVMKLCSWPLFDFEHLLGLKQAIYSRFAECLFPGTRQRCILPSAFVLALDKEAFCRVHFFLALGKSVFQSTFWGPKWIEMKNFSTTKLYNFSRSTKFILFICSFGKATITLFIKSTSLILVSWK